MIQLMQQPCSRLAQQDRIEPPLRPNPLPIANCVTQASHARFQDHQLRQPPVEQAISASADLGPRHHKMRYPIPMVLASSMRSVETFRMVALGLYALLDITARKNRPCLPFAKTVRSAMNSVQEVRKLASSAPQGSIVQR